MKVSSTTLKAMAAGAMITGTAGGAVWFCVDQAVRARDQKSGMSAAASNAPRFEWAVRAGEVVLDGWTAIGIKLGIIEEPPRARPYCDACGMG